MTHPSGMDPCASRCLLPETVAAVRMQLGAEEVRRVQFTCRLSLERTTAVLIGTGVVERLLAVDSGLLRTETEARAAASLMDATLCACDVATLLDQPQPMIECALRRLAHLGVVEEQTIAGMPYFALTQPGRDLLERTLPTLTSTYAPRTTTAQME